MKSYQFITRSITTILHIKRCFAKFAYEFLKKMSSPILTISEAISTLSLEDEKLVNDTNKEAGPLKWGTHVSYSSIENLNDILIKRFESQNLLQICDWVATEKIHGANFSFITNGKEVKCARRKGILKEDENFFHYKLQLRRYSKNVLSLYNYMKEKELIKGEMIIIYGEVFGGKYPHPSTPNEKKSVPVQQGVYYTPTYEFLAFDLFDGKDYLNFDLMVNLFEENKIPYIKELARGNFNDMVKYNPEFESTIPTEYFGLPKLTDYNNLAEGVVIKPIKNLRTVKGSRVTLKIKIENFEERKKNPNKENKKKKKPKASDEVSYVFKQFINMNRLESVISKEGELNEENYKEIAELLFEDALIDFKKSEMSKKYDKLNDSKKQTFKSNGIKVANAIIQGYIKKIDI